jgi:nucleotide-binding universal stress UspA family protein
MYHHILIPTDGSPLSTVAMEKSVALARDLAAKVTVVTVVEPFHALSVEPEQISDMPVAYRQHAREEAGRVLTEAELKAKTLGVHCEVVQVEHEHPYQVIIDTAARRGCDLIAMASHGRRGIAALVLGSETSKVLTHSNLPVLVYR